MFTLQTVYNYAFSGLVKLESIMMDNCVHLHSLNVLAFDDCKHLTSIGLHNNGLKTLQEGLLPWDALQSLSINGNPLQCDCSLLWVSENKFMAQLIATQNIMCTNAQAIDVKHAVLNLTQKDITTSCAEHDQQQQATFLDQVFITIAVTVLSAALMIVAGYLLTRMIEKRKVCARRRCGNNYSAL